MHVHEINSKYVFTDGEIISIVVDYQKPAPTGFVAQADITVKAKRSLDNTRFEYCTLILKFTAVVFMHITENFRNQSKISDITLKKLENGNFYVSLHPFNHINEPNANDNFVIEAEGFTFDMLAK